MKTLLLFILVFSLFAPLGSIATADTPSINAPGIKSITQPNKNPSKEALQAPEIYDISTNLDHYSGGIVPRYARFEITFQLNTSAQNPQLPYDANPPAGLQAGIGISVDALFSPDNWQTTYSQPAFYYEEFDDQVKNDREWFYPTGAYSWKARFTPTQTGAWQYKIVARDASGTSESPAGSFEVGNSSRKGFIRVSPQDARYFEYQDGSYFPALGYNMNYNHVSWNNPVLENQQNFQIMSQNGIQLVRIWLSEWGIFDASWNPWYAIDPQLHGQYIPETGLTMDVAYPGSDVSMALYAGYNPCMFLGFQKASPAVKPNTTYRVRLRYKTIDISGPRVSGHPYGLVAKTGGWLWGDGQYCQDSGTGTAVTGYQPADTADWQILEGSLSTGNENFLPYFYLALENVTDGGAYIDQVWIEEDLGNGQYGPNIVSSSRMAHHLYMDQRNSYAFDKVVELAEQNGIYLRPVVLEKNSWIFNKTDFQGEPIPDDPACWDGDPGNDPQECPGNDWFYGDWRQVTKVRWLQQAWWRYLQARWGYSTSIHSWELLNEGDPFNERHYTLADEFGKYMHQFQPDDHLVSTSFWHSFPRDEFWSNSEYSHVDFADVHRYIPEDDPLFNDSAQATYDVSMQYGALEAGGAGKPVIRGETGFTSSASGPPSDLILQDSEGIWLHNFIWGGINPGGLIESYWYENYHIYQYQGDGSLLFDHRNEFGTYYDFIKNIPLNNGHYQDVQAEVSGQGIRVWGQKDTLNNRAHLWIQNEAHTWHDVIAGEPIEPRSAEVTISGFQPGLPLTVEWWNTYTGALISSNPQQTNPSGGIVLSVTALADDVAVKIRVPVNLNRKVYLPQVSSN